MMANDKKVVIDITAKDETKKATKSAEENFTAMGKAAVAVGITMVASLGIVVARQIGETTAEVQRLNGMLKTATGSTEAANAAFSGLQEFATTTPFLLNDVVDAFVKMKNLGLDPSEEALTSYGNTATAMGKSLNQMIEAVADAATGEFERLKEFGIKSKSEGDNVTFTFKGVATTVKKSSEAISGYLKDIGDNNFGGAMADQMNTINGAVSNLQGNLDKLFTLNESNAQSVVDGISLISEAVSELNEGMENFGQASELFAAYSSGRIGFWDWFTANPEDAKLLIADAALIDDELNRLQQTVNDLNSQVLWDSEKWKLTAAKKALSDYEDQLKETNRLMNASATLGNATPDTSISQTPFGPEPLIDIEAQQLESSLDLQRQMLDDFSAGSIMNLQSEYMLKRELAEGEEQEGIDRTIRKMALAEELAAFEKSMAWSIAQNAIDAGEALFGKSKASAIAGIVLNKAMALSANATATAAGTTLAYASQLVPGDPVGSLARGAAAAAKVQALGAINAGLIAATGLGQVASLSGGGTGGGSVGGGGGSGGDSSIPEIPQDTQGQGGGNTFIIETVIGNEVWVEETLIPLMNDSIDRGVTLNVRA